MASSEGDQLLAEAFHVIMDKRGWYTSNCKEVELEINFHVSRILFQKDSSHKYQFCTKVRAPSRLASKVFARCKDFPTKILKRDARTNSS